MRMYKSEEQLEPGRPVREVCTRGDRREIDGLLAWILDDPAARLRIFVRDWAGVDRVRVRMEAAGLGDRVSVHHRAALGCLGVPRAP